MKTRNLIALACFAGLATSATATPPGEYYNGDPDLINGLAAEGDTFTPGFISMIYENFDHTGGDISDVWGNFFISTKVQSVSWEIRSGMSPGNGGSLIASGFSSFGNGELAVDPNGFDAFGFLGYEARLDIPDVAVGPGQYWLGLAVYGSNDGGRAFAQESSGANGFGSPVNDNKGIWNSPVFGQNYSDVLAASGQGNFSFGVNNRVPAPASVALLGLSGLVAGRRRRA